MYYVLAMHPGNTCCLKPHILRGR